MKLQINNINKSYLGEYIFNDFSLDIVFGHKIAILGENGSGKSTLLKLITGIETLTSGDIIIPKGTKVTYTRQNFEESTLTLRHYILKSFPDFLSLRDRLHSLEEAMNTNYSESLLLSYSKIQEQFIQIDGYTFESNLESYAKALDCYRVLDNPYNTLSGGEKVRGELLRVLLEEGDIICMDEPTNHLDLEGILWLEAWIKKSKKTIIIVSHDRMFLDTTIDTYINIDNQEPFIYYGNYSGYLEAKALDYEKRYKDYELQVKEIKRLEAQAKQYRIWAHEGDNDDFYRKAKTLEKRISKIERLPKPEEIKNRFDLRLLKLERSGKNVLEFKDLVLGYNKPLNQPLNLSIKYQARIGLSAANGSGKTTLIKTILKESQPLEGSVLIGNNVRIGYLPQIIVFEKEKSRLIDYIKETYGYNEFDTRRVLARLGFYKESVYISLNKLSGGERVRVKLLDLMLEQCNLIILDEPTNHLDIHSIELLEEVLNQYQGTLLVISHDRMFLNTINTINYNLERYSL